MRISPFPELGSNLLSSRIQATNGNWRGLNGTFSTFAGNITDLAGTMSEQKLAVITGSSSGIGLLTAIEFAQHGYQVVATMRDLARSDRLESAAAEAAVSDRLELRRLDITHFDTLVPTVESIVRDHGRIDVLVNNAGFSVAGFGEDLSLDDYRHQFETNFFATVAMSKAVLPVMRRQRAGHIIQVASVAGRVGTPLLSAYCSSKHALEGFSESLRIETHSLGIRVVLVEPGAFDTDIWTRNVTIGAGALDPDSPNKDRSQRFTEFVKGNSKNRRDAREVARLILGIANDPNPKLRYLIGTDARMQVWLKRLMPWRRYERMVAKFVKIDE
jgi:NAD(P)-dependent dehydrogenase (short-subunit alcohol dehydrogenase family)